MSGRFESRGKEGRAFNLEGLGGRVRTNMREERLVLRGRTNMVESEEGCFRCEQVCEGTERTRVRGEWRLRTGFLP